MREKSFAVPYALGAVVVVLSGQGRIRGVSFRSAGEVDAPLTSCALARGIAGYLQGRSRLPGAALDIPEEPLFFARVWREVRRIPHGATATYGQVAAAVGRRGAARAVGQAMAANPLPLFVPCHRVVAAHGLGGFSSGLAVKRWLLELEGGAGGSPSAEGPLGEGRHRRCHPRPDRARASRPAGRRKSR